MTEPNPGFRTREMTDEDALGAMIAVSNTMITTALECRRQLLEKGFSDTHTLCRQFDRTARFFADGVTVCQRQLVELRPRTTEE